MKPLSSKLFSPLQRSYSAGGKYSPSMQDHMKIKRFYKKVDIIEHPLSKASAVESAAEIDHTNLSASPKYWAVTLDGRVVKTMYKDPLLIPTQTMALALAEEWDS